MEELVEVESKLPEFIRQILNIPEKRLINPERDVSHTTIGDMSFVRMAMQNGYIRPIYYGQ